MCTVSFIPLIDDRGGLRIVCNRDEKRSRPAASMPREQRQGQRRALYPLDPAGGGTWIAASDAGVVLLLLNVNESSSASGIAEGPQRRSRGLIITSLLHLGGVDEMVQACLRLRAAQFKPFQLVIVSIGGAIVLHSDGVVIRCIGAVLPQCVAMFTSSGLGDHLVEPPRRALFDTMLGDGLHSAARQDAFHRHHWIDRPHLSVQMSREDARTVSRTVIELKHDQIMMHYATLDECGLETDTVTCLLPVHLDALDLEAGIGFGFMPADAIVAGGAAK